MNGVAPFASKQVDMQKLQRRLCFPVDRWERVRSQSSTDTSITQFVVVNGRSKVGVFQSDNSPVLLCLSDLEMALLRRLLDLSPPQLVLAVQRLIAADSR